MVKDVYVVKKDKSRSILKRCGECMRQGRTKEFGKHWSTHWKNCHKGIKPYGKYVMTKGDDEVEVDLEHLQRGTQCLLDEDGNNVPTKLRSLEISDLNSQLKMIQLAHRKVISCL